MRSAAAVAPHTDASVAEAIRVLDIHLARQGQPALDAETRRLLYRPDRAFTVLDELEARVLRMPVPDPRNLLREAHYARGTPHHHGA